MGDIESLDAGERRQYFRVNDTILLQAEAIPADVLPTLRERLSQPLPDAFYLASEFNRIKQETAILHRQLEQQSRSLLRYVDALDSKLDRIAEVLLVQAMGADGARRVEVDIGAEGMGFPSPEPFPGGAVLDLRLALLSSGTGVRLLGEVVRCQRGEDGYQVGVAFEHLREADRELLVQHVLRRQASMLRSRHE